MSVKPHIVKSVRHSILTSMSLDAIGLTLSHCTPAQKTAWLEGSKALYPQSLTHHQLSGRGSYNSDMLAFLLRVLADHAPTSVEDYQTWFREELDEELAGYRHPYELGNYVNQLDEDDSGRVVSVALAAAYFVAMTGVGIMDLIELYVVLCECTLIGGYEMNTGLAVAYTVHRLFVTGYFGWHSLSELKELGMLEGGMARYVDELLEYNLDHEYLSKRFEDVVHPNMTYTETIVAQTFFFMSRVGTAYTKDKLRSLPRQQLPEIMHSQLVAPHDGGFLFGAVCTVSEPNYHPLVTKHLREGVTYRKELDELLTFLN